MAKFAMDIDDNLYSFTDLAREVLLQMAIEEGDDALMAGAYAPWPEWRSPPDLIGLDRWLEIINTCHSEENIMSRLPFDGAADTLRELKKAGHEFIYISDRNSSCQDATSFWLSQYHFPDGELVCTADKAPYMSQCKYLIDDRPKTLVNFIHDFTWKHSNGSSSKEHQRLAFGLQRPYNQALSDVPGIYLAPSWSGIRHYLTKKDLIPQSLSYSSIS